MSDWTISGSGSGAVGAGSATIDERFAVGGVLVNAATVSMTDNLSSYAIRRADTLEVVVSAGATPSNPATGVYRYAFTGVPGVEYQYSFKFIYSGVTYYQQGTIRVPLQGKYAANLLGARQALVESSGHYELVNSDWTDNGANRFLNAGQRWLDRAMPYHKQDAWLYYHLDPGEYLITFRSARIIRAVWRQSEYSRQMLERLFMHEFLESYGLNLDASVTGTPIHWTPITVDASPAQASSDLPSGEPVISASAYPYRGLVIGPPVDTETIIQIHAAWYSPELINDIDTSFWAYNHQELLVRAAMAQIEIDLHRNTTGRRDFEEPLLADLSKIYHDMVAEEVSVPSDQMVLGG